MSEQTIIEGYFSWQKQCLNVWGRWQTGPPLLQETKKVEQKMTSGFVFCTCHDQHVVFCDWNFFHKRINLQCQFSLRCWITRNILISSPHHIRLIAWQYQKSQGCCITKQTEKQHRLETIWINISCLNWITFLMLENPFSLN